MLIGQLDSKDENNHSKICFAYSHKKKVLWYLVHAAHCLRTNKIQTFKLTVILGRWENADSHG